MANGTGAFFNNLLAAASSGMIIVLNLGYGMNSALVGWLGMLPRLSDAITVPIMGHVSDHTRSRWAGEVRVELGSRPLDLGGRYRPGARDASSGTASTRRR